LLSRGRAALANLRGVPARKATEAALQASEAQLHSILDSAMDAIITVDQDQRIVLFNRAAERVFGCPSRAAIGRSMDRFIPARHREAHGAHVRAFNSTGASGRRMGSLGVLRALRANGEEFPVEAAISRAEHAGRRFGTVILRDITERVRAEEALRASEALKAAILEASLDAVVPFDAEGRVLDYNGAAERLFGRTREEAVGRPVAEMLAPPELRPDFERWFTGAMEAGADPLFGRHLETNVMRADGSEFPAELVISAVSAGTDIPLFSLTLRDITERRQHEQALRAQSLRDELTGLYNRRGFFTIAERQARVAARTGSPFWLLFADVDDLKTINDSFGHLEGDQAITDVARVLRETFRDSDLIARIGGDEFVVLAAEADGAGAERMMLRLREHLAAFARANDRPYALSISVGRSLYDPEKPCPIEDLLARSDAEMYRQKRSDRSVRSARMPP
jgi:diguanylate cyclase (GGDEF)-like protein/PAS domain S-box-containing protein